MSNPDVTTNRPRVLAALARRWPTALGAVVGVDSLFGEVTGDTTRTFAGVLPLLPLLYVVVLLLGRRHWTWPVLFAGLGVVVALRLQDRVEPAVVLLALALGAATWGVGHGRHREREFRIQVAGMAGFAALAVAGLAVDPDLARYLVAAGWIGHGVWDYVHLALDRVVARSFAEWCGVVDVLIGTSLIVVPLL
jgi:hypothetical protein